MSAQGEPSPPWSAPPLEDGILARLFQSSPDAILIADDQGRYVAVNAAACRMLGAPEEELLGRCITDLVEPERAAKVGSHFSEFMASGVERGEFTLRRPDGQLRVLEFSAVPHFVPGLHASFLRDVTARKAGEELSLKFRALVENSADFIGFATADGVPIYINRAGLRMVGLSDLDDAQSRRVMDFHLEEDRAFVASDILPAVMQHGRWDGEFRFRNFETGAAIPVHYNFFKIVHPQTEEVLGIATVTQDITAVKRQRDHLEASERELRLLTEAIPQMVWTSRPDGSHTYFNKRWTDFSGLTLEQSVGWGWQQTLHPDDLARATEAWNRSLQTGAEYQIEYRMRDKAGAYHWQLARALPLRALDGAVSQWFGTCTDIDAQRNARELLQEAQSATERERKRLFAIFMDAPVIINVVRGADLVIEFTNRLYQALFGPERQLDGLPLAVALPEIDANLLEVHHQVISTGKRFVSGEVSAVLDYDNDGHPHERIWHAIYEPLRNDRGVVDALMTFAFEVTDQVRARNQTQGFIRQLEQEREIREQFVSALSHDLRTPLTAAKMSAQMNIRLPTDPDRVQRNSSRVIHNIERADAMIRDLLDSNLLRAGERLPIRPEEMDLQAQVREALDELAAVHGDQFDFLSPGPVMGRWDALSLRRALENLCNNAVKYGSRQERISVRLCQTGTEVLLSVHNAGNPLSPSDQAELFKPFHRSASAQSSGSSGWGIGLTIVKGVAEAHGGSVEVASSSAQGTTFTLHLPAAPPD